MRRILLAFVITVVSAGLASAAVNDIKVSGDITTTGVNRDLSMGQRLDSDADGATNRDTDSFIMTQIRLRFDVDLTEDVAAVVQLINERLQHPDGRY